MLALRGGFYVEKGLNVAKGLGVAKGLSVAKVSAAKRLNKAKVGVIFDCDGTLIDSMQAWRNLEGELGRRAGAELTSEDRIKLTTLNIPESAQYFHDRFDLGSSGADVVEMMNEIMLEFYRNRAEARPGVLAFMEALAERGVVMSVASSSPQKYLQAGLACAGIAPYVKAIVSVEDVRSNKREPKVYRYTRERMGTPLETTWGFEDAVYALRTLAQAGFGTVGVYDHDIAGTWEQLTAEADFAIRSFEELDADAFLEAVAARAGRA